jgi:predicted lysophospholipase L1 biosynthesis ABC-type transport system permease subunit
LIRVLGFALGLVVGAAFKPLIELSYAWTAYLLKKATGRVSLWEALVASIVASVIAFASLLLPLLPLGLIGDRQAYMAASVWGVLVGFVIQRVRELRDP